MSLVKINIALLLLLIVLSLGAGMFSLIKDRNETNRTARFLTLRIALSVFTFFFILLSFFMGWIQPHGVLPPGS